MTAETLAPPARDFAPGETFEARVDLYDPEPRVHLTKRLEELALLESDWDGYGATPIDRRALERARLLVEQGLRSSLPLPALVPVPDGGVQLEWTAGPVELEMEIEPGGHSAIFVCDDHQARQKMDGELPADQALLTRAIHRLAAYA